MIEIIWKAGKQEMPLKEILCTQPTLWRDDCIGTEKDRWKLVNTLNYLETVKYGDEEFFIREVENA